MTYRYPNSKIFDRCSCLEDMLAVKIDPTGTQAIRRRFNATLAAHWRRVRIMVRQAVVEQNILGLGRTPVSSMVANAAINGVTKVQMFQRWTDSVLTSTVLVNDGSFMRQFIQAGYDAGVQHAERELGVAVPRSSNVDRVGTLAALAVVEIQGICEAASQQIVRVTAGALLNNTSAPKLVRRIQSIIDSIGVIRSTAVVELLVVKAFGEATLDVFEAAGIAKVGLVPEAKAARRQTQDARRTGPGSRSSRRTTPSGSTIGRIRALERTFEGTGKVNVETAGDDKVCPVCEDIADDGPYTINKARALIPAHPRCRCIFVPVNQTLDFNPNHDPDNGRFSEGSGGGSGLTKVDGDFTQEEKDQVREYQNGSDINGHLRDIENPRYDFSRSIAENRLNKKQLAAMDSAIAKSTLKKDTILYRGVNKLLLDVPLVKGETFKDPAFAATTTDKRIASGFGDVIEINAPAGTHALDVSDMLKDKSRYNQGEHILARGLTYRVDQTEPLVLTIVKGSKR